MALYTDYREVDVTVTDAAAINNAIKNILMTRVGSLPGKPTFGSYINNVIFSQMDHITEGILVNQIEAALATWETRIIVNNVNVEEIPEFNKIIATIDYQYRDKGLDINEQIAVAFVE
jgi:phage baseplate assembly protein W